MKNFAKTFFIIKKLKTKKKKNEARKRKRKRKRGFQKDTNHIFNSKDQRLRA
jgi:hypothetical protein